MIHGIDPSACLVWQIEGASSLQDVLRIEKFRTNTRFERSVNLPAQSISLCRKPWIGIEAPVAKTGFCLSAVYRPGPRLGNRVINQRQRMPPPDERSHRAMAFRTVKSHAVPISGGQSIVILTDRSNVTDNVGIVVTRVFAIPEDAARRLPLRTGGSIVLVGLIDAADRGTNIFEFMVDIEGDFRQSNNQSENSNRGDQDQFGRDNKTRFVMAQLSQHRSHVQVSDFIQMVWCVASSRFMLISNVCRSQRC
jgi:hypothetical protein